MVCPLIAISRAAPVTMRVPMRFNRLVLLRPWLWHTAGEAFGDSLENGRLIYLMFFASAGQAPAYNAQA